MLWIFLLIVAAMIFGAASTDQITVGSSLSNTYRNAPYVIENFYAIVGLLTLLMATAFVNSAARDFSLNTYQMIFSTPLRRGDFLVGRFLLDLLQHQSAEPPAWTERPATHPGRRREDLQAVR
jgi:hypothetical protein